MGGEARLAQQAQGAARRIQDAQKNRNNKTILEDGSGCNIHRNVSNEETQNTPALALVEIISSGTDLISYRTRSVKIEHGFVVITDFGNWISVSA